MANEQKQERKPVNKVIAAALWKVLSATGIVSMKFNKAVRRHQKHDFLGYVTITLDLSTIVPGFVMSLPGIEVKVLSGGPYLGLPTTIGAGDKRFPNYRFGTIELRDVLTQLTFKQAAVVAALAECNELPKPEAKAEEQEQAEQSEGSAAEAGDNPYAA